MLSTLCCNTTTNNQINKSFLRSIEELQFSWADANFLHEITWNPADENTKNQP